MKTMLILFLILILVTTILFVLAIISLLKYLFGKNTRKTTVSLFLASWLMFLVLTVGLAVTLINKLPSENNEHYVYDSQHIYYVTEGSDWKGEKIEMPDLFNMHYSVHEEQTIPYAIESEGEIVFLTGGPPFSFQIILSDINTKIKYIQFKKCLLLNSTENDLLELNDAGIIYEITFPDTTHGESMRMSEEENHYNFFYANGIFYKREKIEELIDRQKDIKITERRSIIYFPNIPIDYVNDETITIKMEIVVMIENGEEITSNLEYKCKRKLSKKKINMRFPPDYYRHEIKM